MKGRLLLCILSVRSSYARGIEEPATGDSVDTLQWWFGDSTIWRIRTFAIDHDIHMYCLRSEGWQGQISLAKENNAKNYGDVIASEYLIEFDNCEDAAEVHERLVAAGLNPRLEVEPGEFAFWKPDDGNYRTQSTPA